MIKKVVMTVLFISGLPLYSISTTSNHRLVTSSPLLYKQVNYAAEELSLEVEPIYIGMFNSDHTMSNLGINGQSSMNLNQQGLGDINPELILLGSDNGLNNYTSTISLKPKLAMVGALLHFYKQYTNFFFDVKTSLLNCRTIIDITENGGGNGGMTQQNGTIIRNAYQAFTQSDWNYGKFGNTKSVTGLDNIQVMFGASDDLCVLENSQSYFAGFAVIEIPTGSGTKADWLFEPQIGTNHWAIGFGGDYMLVTDNEFSLVLGGNYRYCVSNSEIRSFDLTENGEWSRYLALDTIALLATEGQVPGLPGINLFTQEAVIQGKSQLTLYARLQQRFDHSLIELSYNFFFDQKEKVNSINSISSYFGIYDVGNGGGTTTASTAKISQANPLADLNPVTLQTSNLDLISGAQSHWSSSTIAARFQYSFNNLTIGCGTAIDIAQSLQAISTWSAWLNFEVLLPDAVKI